MSARKNISPFLFKPILSRLPLRYTHSKAAAALAFHDPRSRKDEVKEKEEEEVPENGQRRTRLRRRCRKGGREAMCVVVLFHLSLPFHRPRVFASLPEVQRFSVFIRMRSFLARVMRYSPSTCIFDIFRSAHQERENSKTFSIKLS
jgi:hypothetical protein